MDSTRIDDLLGAFSRRLSRRATLGAALSSLLAPGILAPMANDAEAKKRKKRKNKKKGGGPTPPPGATCSDGVKNGNETDVDCGGPDCPPCANGRLCDSNTDCGTARCGDGRGDGNICQSCESGGGVCGEDENGLCECDLASGICFTDKSPNPNDFEDECPVCPAGSVCRSFLAGSVCWPLCGG
jgi:hypothetical protein